MLLFVFCNDVHVPPPYQACFGVNEFMNPVVSAMNIIVESFALVTKIVSTGYRGRLDMIMIPNFSPFLTLLCESCPVQEDNFI